MYRIHSRLPRCSTKAHEQLLVIIVEKKSHECHTYRVASVQRYQWLFVGLNIGQLTPKIIHFHYLSKCFPDKCIQKHFI